MSKVLSSDGRWLVTAPEGYGGKKYIANRYVLQYRLLMEEFLGRLLKPWEHVHHRNGDKLDDRLENLEILTKKEHNLLHSELNKAKPNQICSQCKKKFHKKLSISNRNKSGTIFCCRGCYKKYTQIFPLGAGGKELNYTCTMCTKQFHRVPSIKNKNKSGTIFCSRNCYNKFVKKNKANREFWNTRVGSRERTVNPLS